jgi:hypothetical protein
MYKSYLNYIRNIDLNNIKSINFKSNKEYTGILEHVSHELGLKYLNLIENEYSNIDFTNIIEFIKINDYYGNPIKYNYNFKNNILFCSPSSLRYIYHSLIILEHYKNTKSKNIVEVGCGYGGLCLAINYFSKLLNIEIVNYNIIDLPEACNLINCYLHINKDNIKTNVSIYSSNSFGEEITDDNLFFISNYCYTEISESLNSSYSKILLPKTTNGFIIWQNGGNNGAYPINKVTQITGKTPIKIIEETPQTDAGFGIFKNYFVYF